MGITGGGRINYLTVTALAAGVTDYFYIPLGGRGAGNAVLQGHERDAIIKKIKFFTDNSVLSLRLVEIGVVDPNGTHIPIMPNDGEIYMGTLTTSGLDFHELNTWVRDIQCVYVVVHNAHGSSGMNFSVTVEWEPAK